MISERIKNLTHRPHSFLCSEDVLSKLFEEDGSRPSSTLYINTLLNNGSIPSTCPFPPLPSMQNPHCLDQRVRFHVNVDVAGPAHFRIDHGNTVADVNCHCCKTPFGWKYVVVPEETIILKTGSFLLHLNKLLMWDGKNMLYADTNEPVENA
ncbi:Protein yippee-like CG15309 [Camellia lanceoleosa]|uniref:Protein yippee-like CG15309 n=1 Tax=Camellia lanceoleosa TaxID=1840588 RepID=A0ACC0F3K6_9ERIC|nr:Protein yippee-like CG15309 [Camellia lanceoleosa]